MQFRLISRIGTTSNMALRTTQVEGAEHPMGPLSSHGATFRKDQLMEPIEKWYGNGDHKTSESYYTTGGREYHNALFIKTLRALTFLSRRREGERYRPAELIYLNTQGPNWVIAYRWTSDKAYDMYEHKLLVKYGSGLGRGVWEPFGDNYQMDTYVLQKEAA